MQMRKFWLCNVFLLRSRVERSVMKLSGNIQQIHTAIQVSRGRIIKREGRGRHRGCLWGEEGGEKGRWEARHLWQMCRRTRDRWQKEYVASGQLGTGPVVTGPLGLTKELPVGPIVAKSLELFTGMPGDCSRKLESIIITAESVAAESTSRSETRAPLIVRLALNCFWAALENSPSLAFHTCSVCTVWLLVDYKKLSVIMADTSNDQLIPRKCLLWMIWW